MKRYLNDPWFWLSVAAVNLVLSSFEGIGRGLAEWWLS